VAAPLAAARDRFTVASPVGGAVMTSKAPAKTLSPAAPAEPKAVDSSSSAAEPSGNAAQLAKTSLRELNKRTAAFGMWTVVVQQAQAQEYEYRWDGIPCIGKNCSCLLVSPDDPSEYCIGQMRWTSKTDGKFKPYSRNSRTVSLSL
jgi:hypothetical protein